MPGCDVVCCGVLWCAAVMSSFSGARRDASCSGGASAGLCRQQQAPRPACACWRLDRMQWRDACQGSSVAHVCGVSPCVLCLLAQETRITKLLVSLKTRLAPYMAGEEEAFREVQVGGSTVVWSRRQDAAAACILLPCFWRALVLSFCCHSASRVPSSTHSHHCYNCAAAASAAAVWVQGINSEQLAAASFGSVMLQTVGRVYQTEADIYQGNALLGGLGKLRRAGHSIR